MDSQHLFDNWLRFARTLDWSPHRRDSSCQLAFAGLREAADQARQTRLKRLPWTGAPQVESEARLGR
ncbi:hypothetical protein J2T57_002483 [Natronocella acetinitrilica]|uniref:Uncharacterized protein n=1 Tax=Natronocella acetinitrilica TaxID=414046 RepID=A0AAE3KBC1_9GAMM|nr:hypothetical protein [Natronocella acetinitrilica]MCP1675335.1 hypothetical protein [Natronocella acetinitrilica]